MQVFVQCEELHTLDVEGLETIGDVKKFVEDTEGVVSEDMVVYCCGKPLVDDTLVSSLDNLSTLQVEVRMLGGKVHGSLARAGKVRGQTPKVEPQEKKKKKTGRAKRRMQYNRRYCLLAASTFGARRPGPNACK